jgi:YHS domain-containing protein/thiol-disulfide isomerase/thioredoxin
MMHHRMPRSSIAFGIRLLTLFAMGMFAVGEAAVAQSAPAGLSWRSDYAAALDEARAENRLLWIQFTGPWCPSCHRMERETFTDPDVIERAKQAFVPLKLRSDVHEQLALSFELSGLPATILVTPDRKVLAVHQGFLNGDELESVLLQAIDKHPAAKVKVRTELARNQKPAAKGKDATEKPKTETKVALSGYCPVSLISDRKLVRGQAEYTIQHEGRVYRFANTLMVNLFRKDPERYIPVNGGKCPVAQTDRNQVQPGDPRWGVLFDGRLFLCTTEADRKLFLSNPERYAAVDVAEQGYCPHCLGESGLLVRGDPRVSATREGRRYWFPDPSHRDAFLAAGGNDGATTRR